MTFHFADAGEEFAESSAVRVAVESEEVEHSHSPVEGEGDTQVVCFFELGHDAGVFVLAATEEEVQQGEGAGLIFVLAEHAAENRDEVWVAEHFVGDAAKHNYFEPGGEEAQYFRVSHGGPLSGHP